MMNNICRNFSQLTKSNTSILSNNILRYVAYKSAISLENIYPHSSLKLTTPERPVSSGNQFSGFIPIDELDISYSRSSGPGGQNVNKVNTKVDLRFHVQSASWLNDEIKSKILEKFNTKITKEGFLVFRSDLTRSQQLNLADCLEKVRSAIRTATITPPEPSEESQERVRRRHERAIRERLMMKRQRSHIKTDRKDPISDM